jgi:CheY-like chemotaxis protein
MQAERATFAELHDRPLTLLPVGAATASSEPEKVSSRPVIEPSQRPIRILVVEDEQHIAKFLQFVLTKGGYDVTLAYDGEEALAVFEQYHPDGVLLDLVLPGISGLDVLRQLRSTPSNSRLAILILTASSVEQLAEEVVQAGADSYCPKPIAPSRLLRKLEELGLSPRPLH